MASRETGQFDRIILPHLDDAYALARYLLRDEHDAQDVVQDAVLRALRHFESYREGDARAWLLAIVRNCCHTWLAKRGNRDIPLADAETEHALELHSGSSADDLAIRSSERAAIQRALDQLPVEFREVIVLREINDLSYKEISLVTGVPTGTVMSRLARARRRLAASLGVIVSQAS